MRIPRLYQQLKPRLGETLELDQRASKHIVQVLRMQAGQPLVIFDGEGACWQASLLIADKRAAAVEINKPLEQESESPLSIHLGLGISKGERMDYAIQKAVELGVNEITPLFTQYTMVKLDTQRQHKRLQHWQGIMISACEQCGRNVLPGLHQPVDVDTWLNRVNTETRLVLEPSADLTLASIIQPGQAVTLLIGPEGGLNDTEITTALENGFQAVQLGPRILRTETAVVAALTALQISWGDLK